LSQKTTAYVTRILYKFNACGDDHDDDGRDDGDGVRDDVHGDDGGRHRVLGGALHLLFHRGGHGYDDGVRDDDGGDDRVEVLHMLCGCV
jgi:hypothetical protein